MITTYRLTPPVRTPVETALRDAKLSFKDLDEVILVGGSTCIIQIKEMEKVNRRKYHTNSYVFNSL
ncbi:hypothetical protein VitviT2T_020556 [Vitis vinifera]|uniref:Uncharacterized protein n=1 Tax=Vitis vinifera TaxID=29760 RepID=A0ABY9D6F4_VITVI|nr:hypothetical protein VitviT2T_020556 [Vitis vinifera]